MDGGKAQKAFHEKFTSTTGQKHADVVVCTHNDADHANGIAGFLQNDLTCGEVWLPHIWTARLNDLIGKPGQFLQELANDVANQQTVNQKGSSSLQQIGKHQAKERFGEVQNSMEERPKKLHSKDSSLNFRVPKSTNVYEEWRGKNNANFNLDQIWILSRIAGWQPEFYWTLFLEAISAAKNIWTIVVSCQEKSIPIRWFKYNELCASGGIAGKLEPLNSVEVTTEVQEGISTLKYLALTTANRTSLTFCSPANEHFPGIVFSADSDLRFPQKIPWSDEMIVTAPHHGSEDNAYAYSRVKAEIPAGDQVIWIRSDGKFKKRPGPSFLRQPKLRRFCTNCSGASFHPQDLTFICSRGRWIPSPPIHDCPC